MKLARQWQKQVFAAVLGAAVVGAPLFAVHAEEPAFSRDGQHYDVRRGMYEKDGGSDEHVRLGQYADKEHQEARNEERRNDLEKRQAKERDEFEKRQAEERKDLEKQQAEERKDREEPPKEARHEERHHDGKHHDGEHHDGKHHDGEHREHKYDVRRGMYEKDGGSDTQVRRGMYEDDNRPEDEKHTLTR